MIVAGELQKKNKLHSSFTILAFTNRFRRLFRLPLLVARSASARSLRLHAHCRVLSVVEFVETRIL